MADEGTIRDLVSFLGDSRPELRKASVDLVLGLTVDDGGIGKLVEFDAVKPLCQLLGDVPLVSKPALQSLVNISASHPNLLESMRSAKAINRIINLLEDSDWKMKELALMFLANLTSCDELSRDLIVEGGAIRLRKLVTWLISSEPEPEGVDDRTGEVNWDDDFQYVASILANISRLHEGREFLKQPLNVDSKEPILKLLFPQLNSPSNVRRKGIIATIRNICFDDKDHYLLYEEYNIVPHLLFPLAGPEPLDEDDKNGLDPFVYRLGEKKKRESDSVVRRLIVEVLVLLATTRNGRNVLRKKKVYPIIRNAHIVENDETTGEEIYKLVDLLIRDEEGEEPDWEAMEVESKSAQQRSQAAQAVKDRAHLIHEPAIPTNVTKDPNRFQDAEDSDDDLSTAIQEIKLGYSSMETDGDIPDLV